MARYRVTIAFTLFLLSLIVLLFFYERHNIHYTNELAYQACVRQNLHMKALNEQTLILKEIMRDVGRRQQENAEQSRKDGNLEAAAHAEQTAKIWLAYNSRLFRVPLASCRNIYKERN